MENSLYEEMSDKRPEGFEFPPAYQELISHAEEPNLRPWRLLSHTSNNYLEQVKRNFPDRRLVPFAQWTWGIKMHTHVTPFDDSYTGYWDDREEYVPAVLLERSPFPTFESWLNYAKVCIRFYDIDRAGRILHYALKDIDSSIRSMHTAELNALEARAPGFSDTLAELLGLFEFENGPTFDDRDRGPEEGEEDYHYRKLAELLELYKKENYQKGLFLLASVFPKAGITPPKIVLSYAEWLANLLELDIPQLAELTPDEDAPEGSKIPITWRVYT